MALPTFAPKALILSGLLCSALALSPFSWAAGTHAGSHAKQNQMQQHHMTMAASHTDMAEQHQEMAQMMGQHGGGHAHDSWAQPPAAYSSIQSPDWSDAQAAERGQQIYQQQCAACHGDDGRGTGPVAASLEHPPADLTNHFHMQAGMGDAYLFWRVTEGGQVEPFKSAKSAMPAFKGTLSESQRWDVLTYIHQQFHGGFRAAGHQNMKALNGSHGGMERSHGNH